MMATLFRYFAVFLSITIAAVVCNASLFTNSELVDELSDDHSAVKRSSPATSERGISGSTGEARNGKGNPGTWYLGKRSKRGAFILTNPDWFTSKVALGNRSPFEAEYGYDYADPGFATNTNNLQNFVAELGNETPLYRVTRSKNSNNEALPTIKPEKPTWYLGKRAAALENALHFHDLKRSPRDRLSGEHEKRMSETKVPWYLG